MFKVQKIIDLSMPLTNNTPVYPGDPQPKISIATTIEKEGYNLHYVHIGSQTGSHVDAPYHFCNHGQRIDESDLRLFIGTGVVIPVTGKGEQEEITLQDVEPYLDQLAPEKIVLFHTGWSRYAGEEKYFRHPYVNVEVIDKMIRRGIRTFFIDAINIDLTGGTSFPVHDAIAAVNGIIAENVTNIESIDFPNPLICAFPLKIVGVDGSPVRAVAIQMDADWESQK
ncbi:cyclase family protein [Microaerobacter geothermalis]|uniref:cyclase family protein n=1 Tax=Microaerobacter geothermalis TaxID=674972 RepID=UPI001F3331E7|nr:cyclase family protein [Microaerobacter geothermalis]MCF6093502.1 cyclase family protein [Microaerobacter geothermalis]